MARTIAPTGRKPTAAERRSLGTPAPVEFGAARTRPYFVVVAALPGGAWGVEFGDFDRDVADAELRELRDGERCRGLPRSERSAWQLIRCADARQATVNAAVAALPRNG